ncbi:hypothetical protein [Nocardia gipuzkoensis]
MKFHRLEDNCSDISVRSLSAEGLVAASLLGDNRELMRHDEGAIHAVLTGSSKSGRALYLFGSREFNQELTDLSGPFATHDAADPATDSNQNGVYVAFTQSNGGVRAGYIAHVPDPFGDPGDIRVHGPLTPTGADADNSFLQASRAENSVVYAWRTAAGEIHVGISPDGVDFPTTTSVVADAYAVRGPAIGIQGDYAIFAYQTKDPRFAPVDSQVGDGAYYVWLESGDSGATWTEPKPLFPDISELPLATGLSLESQRNDLIRSEIKVSGAGNSGILAAQLLAWVNAEDYPDSRVFALATLAPAADSTRWAPSVGVLAFKDFGVGGEWGYTVTNRDLYRRSGIGEDYAGRAGKHFKYSALPGTPVRVVSYVDSAPSGSGLEDQVAILVSTTKGETFEYESVFTASELNFSPDAELLISNSACCYADHEGGIWQDLLVGDARRPDTVVHATLPIGLTVEGRDPTLVW